MFFFGGELSAIKAECSDSCISPENAKTPVEHGDLLRPGDADPPSPGFGAASCGWVDKTTGPESTVPAGVYCRAAWPTGRSALPTAWIVSMISESRIGIINLGDCTAQVFAVDSERAP